MPDWSRMEVIPKSSSYHVPYFILAVSIAELVAFLYEVVRLKNDSCIDVDAAGPPPLCSPLIYNPYRKGNPVIDMIKQLEFGQEMQLIHSFTACIQFVLMLYVGTPWKYNLTCFVIQICSYGCRTITDLSNFFQCLHSS